ncbi:hypothetical protein T439DRAFT_323380 [Meredithblackwellia eburnea MCA 4105]
MGPVAPALSLPPEVLELIFHDDSLQSHHQVADYGRRSYKHILPLSLVHSTWCIPGQRALWNNIFVSSHNQLDKWIASPVWKARSNAVRKMVLQQFPTAEQTQSMLELNDRTSLEGLKELFLTCDPYPPQNESGAFWFLGSRLLENLTHLVLSRFRLPTEPLSFNFQASFSLKFLHISFYYRETSPEPNGFPLLAGLLLTSQTSLRSLWITDGVVEGYTHFLSAFYSDPQLKSGFNNLQQLNWMESSTGEAENESPRLSARKLIPILAAVPRLSRFRVGRFGDEHLQLLRSLRAKGKGEGSTVQELAVDLYHWSLGPGFPTDTLQDVMRAVKKVIEDHTIFPSLEAVYVLVKGSSFISDWEPLDIELKRAGKAGAQAAAKRGIKWRVVELME